MLPEKLKSFSYYVQKCPLYLRQDTAFLEHFRIWFDVLTNVDESSDKLFEMLDIFKSDYLKSLSFIDSSNNLDVLDKLGSIFGVTRTLSIIYEEENVKKQETITLDDHDFLILIKAQIIKNYSDGSFSQLTNVYKSAGLDVLLLTSQDYPAAVNVHLINLNNSTYSENLKKLFLSGLLTIKSVGITYSHVITEIDEILIWDDETHGLWDSYGWFI